MKSTRNSLRFNSNLALAKKKLRREKLAAEAKKPALRLVPDSESKPPKTERSSKP